MLEGNPVENTPADLIRQVEAWVETYPEERGNVADALANAVDRLREPGPNLQPFTWAMVGEPEPRSWLIDQWLPGWHCGPAYRRRRSGQVSPRPPISRWHSGQPTY